jgi:hypothetical protein
MSFSVWRKRPIRPGAISEVAGIGRNGVGLESIAISNVAAGGSGDQAHVDRATRGGSQRNTHHRRPEFTRLQSDSALRSAAVSVPGRTWPWIAATGLAKDSASDHDNKQSRSSALYLSYDVRLHSRKQKQTETPDVKNLHSVPSAVCRSFDPGTGPLQICLLARNEPNSTHHLAPQIAPRPAPKGEPIRGSGF